jgi:hypothetical protein
MLALCKCHEVPSWYRLHVSIPPSIFKEESPKPRPLGPIFPLECSKKQCPFYIRDESKSYEQRIGEFCRPMTMMNHVENIHLKGRDPEAKIECFHPTCKSQGLVLEKLEYFKSHVELVHVPSHLPIWSIGQLPTPYANGVCHLPIRALVTGVRH